MIGQIVSGTEKSDPAGYEPLECFYSLDTHGKSLPCKDYESLAKVLRGKQSWNLQMRMWAEGLADMILFPRELAEYCQNKPDWIFEGALRQGQKLFLKKYEHLPSFLNPPKFLGAYWLIDQEEFDPSI